MPQTLKLVLPPDTAVPAMHAGAWARGSEGTRRRDFHVPCEPAKQGGVMDTAPGRPSARELGVLSAGSTSVLSLSPGAVDSHAVTEGGHKSPPPCLLCKKRGLQGAHSLDRENCICVGK